MKKKYLFVSLLLSLTSCNSGVFVYENHSISIIENEFIRASVLWEKDSGFHIQKYYEYIAEEIMMGINQKVDFGAN